MAENPASWGPTEKLIDEAIKEWEADMADPEFIATGSLPWTIANKLREYHLVIPDADREAFTRAIDSAYESGKMTDD